MILTTWAARWGVPYAALAELYTLMGTHDAPGANPGMSEAGVQSRVRLAATKAGHMLWRNNVGALLDVRGVPVRYGLANDNKTINDRIKSGDLIGIHRLLIEPQHVGHVVGQFWSVECKEGSWTYRGDKHEQAQLAWANLVIANGGRAQFTTGAL